ncbi:MAG: hypothetical protein ACRD52_05815 [Candidatus Acidiferrales bacterium]
MRILVALLALVAAIPTTGQSTTNVTTNCNSTTSGNSTNTDCQSTGTTQTQNPNAVPPGAGALYGINRAMKQAQANAQARRALNLQQQALNQEKQQQDRQFELQALTEMQSDVQTFIHLPKTDDSLVAASRNNLVQSYNNLRTLTCNVDGSLSIPDIDGTSNSCAQMAKKSADAEMLKATTGFCKDYAAKHRDKADGHTFKAWGNHTFTCTKGTDGQFTANEQQ